MPGARPSGCRPRAVGGTTSRAASLRQQAAWSPVVSNRNRRASTAARGEGCLYGPVIKTDAPGFKQRRKKAQPWRQASRLETDLAHVDHVRAHAVEALAARTPLTVFSSPVTTTRIARNRLAKAGGSLPPKLCCSFYSSGYSARRLTSLEIAPRIRFQFSRSFGNRRTGPKDDAGWTGWRTEPRWCECHRLLSIRAKEPGCRAPAVDADPRRDMANRPFRSASQNGSPPSATIAPLHDVSSARGLKNIDQTLAIGIALQLGLTRNRPRAWIAHASECDLDPDETIEIVPATARRMPDAAAQARDKARSRDENKAQASVDRRVTEILRYAGARHRTFEQALAGMCRRSG